MFEVTRDIKTGKTMGVCRVNSDGSRTYLDRSNPDFLSWNAAQPVPLDLSDKEPEPPEPDPVKDAIMALLDKDQNGVLSPAEKLDFCFRVCKRLARNI